MTNNNDFLGLNAGMLGFGDETVKKIAETQKKLNELTSIKLSVEDIELLEREIVGREKESQEFFKNLKLEEVSQLSKIQSLVPEELKKAYSETYAKYLKSLTPEKKRCVASSTIYFDALKGLLENEEFVKSDEWVKYIKKQIDLYELALDETSYEPFAADELILGYEIDENDQKRRKKAGRVTSAPFRELEKNIVKRAKELLKSTHDNRPPDRYRTSSLADAIFIENKNIPIQSRLSLPSTSTIIKYLKTAVIKDELPKYLTGRRPKKW